MSSQLHLIENQATWENSAVSLAFSQLPEHKAESCSQAVSYSDFSHQDL